ncbi:MAG TPA: response regulator transcription factor [Ohtaekwangia sp.]|uniref:response regulator transcription factor n=1 Tax=Ohtaekwangia sp. TaxID=2066019 RepID=UPI002F93B600
MVKVVVVGDQAISRLGLIEILKSDPRFEIIGDYRNFNLIKRDLLTLNPKLVFIDLPLDMQAWLDVAIYIKKYDPSIKIIILTPHNEVCHIVSVAESDIDGYILKDTNPVEILSGINRVLDGEKFYSLEISNRLINNYRKKDFRGDPFLTDKEKEIIRYIMEGQSSREIAALLKVSSRTIESHRSNILRKFNLKNTPELISKIAEKKILI